MDEQKILRYLEKKASGTPLDSDEQKLEACFREISRFHQIHAKFDPKKKDILKEKLLRAYDQRYDKKHFLITPVIFQYITLRNILTFASSAFVFLLLFSITLPWLWLYTTTNTSYYHALPPQTISDISRNPVLEQEPKEYVLGKNIGQRSEVSSQEKSLEQMPQDSVSSAWQPSSSASYNKAPSSFQAQTNTLANTLSEQDSKENNPAWSTAQESNNPSISLDWSSGDRMKGEFLSQEKNLEQVPQISVSDTASSHPSSIPFAHAQTIIILLLSLFFATVSTWLLWKIKKK